MGRAEGDVTDLELIDGDAVGGQIDLAIRALAALTHCHYCDTIS